MFQVLFYTLLNRVKSGVIQCIVLGLGYTTLSLTLTLNLTTMLWFIIMPITDLTNVHKCSTLLTSEFVFFGSFVIFI